MDRVLANAILSLAIAATGAARAAGSRAKDRVRGEVVRVTALAAGRPAPSGERPDPDALIALYEEAGGDWRELVHAVNRAARGGAR